MSPDKRTLDELIDDLPDDLKRVIIGELLKNQELPTSPKNKSTLSSIINRFSAMISKKEPNTKPRPRLSEINKEFRDKHSYYERIMKIPSEIEKKETYKTKTPSVVKAIGNISLKKLTDFDDNRASEKIHNHLEDLFYYANLSAIYNNNSINLRYKTYAEAKKQYANLYPESNFEDKVKEWNDMWNYSHSPFLNP